MTAKVFAAGQVWRNHYHRRRATALFHIYTVSKKIPFMTGVVIYRDGTSKNACVGQSDFLKHYPHLDFGDIVK